ncbi:hypothetical protein HFO04_32870 [Rhizobium laguerreae]|uniref:hypothetical protein n=1 Tax=Rhizobium laguerreae TaxID=1076926 RepID=UPI001C918301|nr:hypothetical protein [Rhizobium laguerreae]MBY3307524.1 hypothetical protein [Rhizobium laguerreae]
MDSTVWIVAAVVAVVVVVAIAYGARLGWIKLEFLGNKIEVHEGGDRANANDAIAGENVIAETPCGGTSTAERAHAEKGDVWVSSGGKRSQ